MYQLRPPAVYAHESVVANPTYKARLDRVVAALAAPVQPIVYTDDQLPALVRKINVPGLRAGMGTLKVVPDPILMFNTFRFDGKKEQQYAKYTPQMPEVAGMWNMLPALLGYEPFKWERYNLEGDPARHDKVCRPCWRVHFQHGCAHKCHYCCLGGLLISMVNAEDYTRHFDELIKAHPWQEVYLLEDDADVLCLEPELGCMGPIFEYFGTLHGRYVVVHTKSANVDWMLNLKHNGNTIVVWSLAAPTQAKMLEPVTGTTEERIEAARKCQQAGYPIRYKFKPIIPTVNWRQEADYTIDLLFEPAAKPDLISLSLFMWMDVGYMKDLLGTEILDPQFLKAAEDAKEQTKDTIARPFPHEVRREIYTHYINRIRLRDKEIPVSLSTENFRMWKDLGPALGASPTDYVCGCGPNSIPGRKKLSCHAFQIAQKDPSGKFDQI